MRDGFPRCANSGVDFLAMRPSSASRAQRATALAASASLRFGAAPRARPPSAADLPRRSRTRSRPSGGRDRLPPKRPTRRRCCISSQARTGPPSPSWRRAIPPQGRDSRRSERPRAPRRHVEGSWGLLIARRGRRRNADLAGLATRRSVSERSRRLRQGNGPASMDMTLPRARGFSGPLFVAAGLALVAIGAGCAIWLSAEIPAAVAGAAGLAVLRQVFASRPSSPLLILFDAAAFALFAFPRNDGLGFWQLPGPWPDVFRVNLPGAVIALTIYISGSAYGLVVAARGLRLVEAFGLIATPFLFNWLV